MDFLFLYVVTRILRSIHVLLVARVWRTWSLWFRLQKTADFPHLQFIAGRRFPCRGAEGDSRGLGVRQTIEFPPLLLYMVVNVPVVWSCRSSTSLSCRTDRSPWSCLLGRPWRLRSCSMFPGCRYPCCAGRACYARCCCDRRALFRFCGNSWRFRSRSSFPVVDVAVLCSDKLSRDSEGATDSVHRWSQWTFQSPQRQVCRVAAVHGGPCLAGMVAAMRGSLLQFCSIFRPPSTGR